MSTREIRLTEYSHGAGCGCKIAPGVLTRILGQVGPQSPDPRLLVGYLTRDDAAVYQINEHEAIVSTTDFFMPIVDDPVDFGAIAAVNAISDVYAMGGRPVIALSILGWPVDRLDPAIAGLVVEGARQSCERAGVALAGGHSIDAPEPIFGLAVTGLVDPRRVRSNDRGRAGDELFLTKPLGVGILTTAGKRGLLEAPDRQLALDLMLQLNDLGAALGDIGEVGAVTDVTGFGLLGHLLEMTEASHLAAELDYRRVPKIPSLSGYLESRAVPGGTDRNFRSYGHQVSGLSEEQRAVLCDPQTSGGLLISVAPEGRGRFLEIAGSKGLDLEPFGHLTNWTEGSPRIRVRG
jgi:selenide,water dikinase